MQASLCSCVLFQFQLKESPIQLILKQKIPLLKLISKQLHRNLSLMPWISYWAVQRGGAGKRKLAVSQSGDL